eukprot:5529268-Ditylum_brightwellii.AAC.1
MKIRGILVDVLIQLFPGVYKDYVVYKSKNKVLYMRMLMVLYGMMVSSMIFYKKYRDIIKTIGFILNPYDMCIANRNVNGKQHTITWHVDNIKSSHVDATVNNTFDQWCEETYGSDLNDHVKVAQGKKHDYLGMILNYKKDGVLQVDMRYHISAMNNKFPYHLKSATKLPWNEKLFKVDDSNKKLDHKRDALFHSFVMKSMFMAKKGRPDVNPGVSFLTTR